MEEKENTGVETGIREDRPRKTGKKLKDNKILGTAGVLIAATVFMSVGQLIGEPVQLLMSASGNDAVTFAGMYLAFIGIWAVFLLLLCKKSNRPMWRAMGREAKGNRISTVLAFGLSLGFGFNLLMGLLAVWNGDIRLVFGEFNIAYFLLCLICVGVQSGAEELVCRLYIFQKLRRIWPDVPAAAILGNALLFAALHLGNPGVSALAIASISLTGIMYSLVVYYFDSFWGCVAAHTAWNFTQSILLGLPNSGIVSVYSVFRLDAASAADSAVYSVNFGIEAAPVTVVIEVLLCIALLIAGRKRGRKPLDVWNTEG